MIKIQLFLNNNSKIKNNINYKSKLEYSTIKTNKEFKFNIEKIFKYENKNNTVLIFEPNNYHYECTPGFTQYFLDLGYNVDIILNSFGNDAFDLFKSFKNIRLFIYININQIKNLTQNITMILKRYKYILIQTTDLKKKNLYKKLSFFKLNNTFFVFHNLSFAQKMKMINNKYKNRIWVLGNYSEGLQVNPHYFGKINCQSKINKTKFFITSTVKRNYNFLLKAVEKLKKDHLQFQIIVTGWSKNFCSKTIPKKLRGSTLIFKYKVTYSQLYKIIKDCDYIIINLDPDISSNNLFRSVQSSGSIQLSYGFLKPVLINRYFASFYKMNAENSFIYDNNNFYEVMKKAILLNNVDYNKKRKNLMKLSNQIYTLSLFNVKKALNSINFS